jgi:chaperonin GroEL
MLNQNFVTSTKNTAVLDSPYVLVVDQKLTNNLLVPILEKVHATGRPLLVIASEIEDNALKTMLVNKLKGAMETVAIKSPGFGTARQDYLADLAVLTGATVISDLTVSLKDVELHHLGSAVKTTSSFHNTVIQGEAKQKKNILNRINEIAVIHVGGSSEVEQKELLDRVEDSLNASRAAIASGIVPGGGVALINCNDSLLQFIMDEISDEEEKFGAICVMIALRSPLEAILRNAGQPEDIVQQIIDSSDPNLGYDAANNKFGDMYASGIIDPVAVTTSAIRNAASVSAQLLLTDVSVTIKRQETTNQ